MASFKVRRLHRAQGGINIGASGVTMSTVITGSVDINCPSAVADARVTGSGAVTDISDGDIVIVTPAASMTAGMFLYSACGIAGGIAASFMNSGSTDVSSSADVSCNFLAIAL